MSIAGPIVGIKDLINATKPADGSPSMMPGPTPAAIKSPPVHSLGNLAACSTADQLAVIIKSRLKRIQYRPALIAGFLAQTGPSLEPEPP